MEIVAKSIASPATARVLLTGLKLCWRVLAPEVFLRQLAALAVLIIARHSLWRTRRWLRALSAKIALPNSRKVYKEELKQARRKCADYKTFQSLGEKLDKAEGKDKWKREDNSPLFDSQHLRERTKRYREMMARGDVDACMYALRGELLRKHFGICNPALFQVCNTGTKVVIEEYVATVCEAMAWVGFSYNSPSTRTDLQTKKDAIHERLAFFNETKHGFGRSALLLSGGASVGMYHFGVVKAGLSYLKVVAKPAANCTTSQQGALHSFDSCADISVARFPSDLLTCGSHEMSGPPPLHNWAVALHLLRGTLLVGTWPSDLPTSFCVDFVCLGAL
ncbi:SDP1L [Symbiodinium necroappetens]|uniref:SDP1L protein n=1 Tax=Symbiodinium necroappetens TaxID=1628268 RepID=A0A813A799_9DINO|nr:SDP1L [Symbiodinium necroappetens]